MTRAPWSAARTSPTPVWRSTTSSTSASISRRWCSRCGEWYEDVWANAAPFDLAGIYEARYLPHTPYLIYLRML